MRYSLAQAEAFYWVARLGGFRAAADHLNLSQPSISLRVRELERALDVVLFDRSHYRPVLTTHGSALFPDVEKLLSQAERVQHTARDTLPGRGILRIGAADSFADQILPGMLATLAQRYPALHIDVTVDFSTRLEKLLFERMIDVGFLSQPRARNRIAIAPLWDLELVWVVGRTLPFEGDVATPHNLVDLPIFTNPSPSGLFTSIQTWFGTCGLRPERLNTCNPLTVIARLASAGTGAALLPRELIENSSEGSQLRILRADPPVAGHPFCAIWWDDEGGEDYLHLVELARKRHQERMTSIVALGG
jgi:DNA-binding transcriptional LysR family regulator